MGKVFLYISFFYVMLPAWAEAQELQGSVYFGEPKRPLIFALMRIQKEGVEVNQVSTNSRGEFKMLLRDTGSYSISVHALEKRVIDTLFERVRITGDSILNFYVRDFCQFDDKRKSPCPVCHKRNKVIPIIYGYPLFRTEKEYKAANGVTALYAGCEVTGCDPNWFCKRDKTQF